MSLLKRLQSFIRISENINKAVEIESVMKHAAPTLPIQQERLVEALQLVIDMGHIQHYVDTVTRFLPLVNGSLLDVGCHACWVAPFYLARGASLYHGVEIEVDPHTDEIRDLSNFHEKSEIYNMPLSLSEYLSCFPNIHFSKCDILDFENKNEFFENICLMNVTEHLMEPKKVFAKIAELMKNGGHFFFTHHNFYCWNGHHLFPQNLAQYDPYDPAMTQLADWNHIFNIDLFDPKYSLNCIRIHELMEIFKKYFQVVSVQKENSPEERGGSRLNSEIRNSLIEYYEDELLVESLLCVGKKPAKNFRKGLKIGDTIPIRFRNTTVKEQYGYHIQLPLGIETSEFELYEDDRKLGPITDATEIRKKGNGRYGFYCNILLMSTSNNTDPLTNGCQYVLRRIKKQ